MASQYGSFDTSTEITPIVQPDINDSSPGTEPKSRSLWTWMRENPKSRWQFLWFFISIFIPPLIAFYAFAFHQMEIAYVIAGVFGLTATLYGANHFRILFALRQQVRRLHAHNCDFRDQHNALNTQVSELEHCGFTLQDTQGKLKQSNLKMIDTIRRFEDLEHQMQILGVSTIDKLDDVRTHANKLRCCETSVFVIFVKCCKLLENCLLE